MGIFYKNIHECLKAVRSGEADATLLSSYQVTIYMHSGNGLISKRLNQPIEMTLAVASGNSYLLDLVNRGIVSWKEQNIDESLMRHTDAVMEITIGDLIQDHYVSVLVIVAILAVSITVPIYGWILSRRRHQLAEQAAIQDLLTGVSGRRAYDQDLDSLLQGEHGKADYAVIVMDGNGLKKVNDRLGHRAGDEMLCGLADCIKERINHFDYPARAYRTGGDEFVIIVQVDQEHFKAFDLDLLERIKAWHGELVDHITVASGHALSSEFPDLSLREIISRADERMYRQKQVQENFDQQQLNRDDEDIYQRLLKMYKAAIDPVTQLPGVVYFDHSQPEIRKEIEARGLRLAILAIKVTPVNAKMLTNLSACFIRMFGKENLSYFHDCYYVMTSEIQLEERLAELYQNVASLSKEASLTMNAGIYVVERDDLQPIEEICQKAEALAKQKCDDHELHIYYATHS